MPFTLINVQNYLQLYDLESLFDNIWYEASEFMSFLNDEFHD